MLNHICNDDMTDGQSFLQFFESPHSLGNHQSDILLVFEFPYIIIYIFYEFLHIQQCDRLIGFQPQ